MYNYFSFWTCVLLFVVCLTIYKAVDFILFYISNERSRKRSKQDLEDKMKAVATAIQKANQAAKMEAKIEGKKEPLSK